MVEVTLKLEWRDILFKDELSIRMLTMFDGKYILWPDRPPGRMRWALARWKDDGFGTPTHGAEATLEDAARAVANNEALRKEIEAVAQSAP